MTEWYVFVDREYGPMKTSQLKKLAEAGRITADSKVRKAEGDWVPASKVKGLFPGTTMPRTPETTTPPPMPPAPSEPGSEYANRFQKHFRVRYIIGLVVLGVFLIALIGAYLGLRETPSRAYAKIIAHGEKGEWDKVWEGMDKNYQELIEAALHFMLVWQEGENLEDLKKRNPKDLFVEMAKKRPDVAKEFRSRQVESCDDHGDHATLRIAAIEDGTIIYDSVHMIKEDGIWKLSFKEPKPKRKNPEVAKSKNPAFRNMLWGMSKKVVKGLEIEQLHLEEDNLLGYSTTVNGMECALIYVFVENRLARARYVVIENHVNKNLYLDNFDALRAGLSKKYGKPIDEETSWKGNLYRNQPHDWGMAVATGELSKFAIWHTGKTTICAFLNGDNFKVNVGVEYSSDVFAGLEQQAREKKDLDQL